MEMAMACDNENLNDNSQRDAGEVGALSSFRNKREVAKAEFDFSVSMSKLNIVQVRGRIFET
jgi:hypothetical protein